MLYVILGPTASGKTAKAVALAKHINGEIISADSRQIYRGMDLGTGKDLEEYGEVKYHLIDICDAGYKYNLFEYLRDYNLCRDDIHSRGKEVILCGGTGLYVESVLKGIRLPEVPENRTLRDSLTGKSMEELKDILSQYKTLHNITDLDTTKRAIRAIEIQEYYSKHPDLKIETLPKKVENAVVIGLSIDRDLRRSRITKRLQARIDSGMIEEVRGLIENNKIAPEDLIYYGLEYKYITEYVMGKYDYKTFFEKLEIAIHQFAKRQMTWFRGMEKRGTKINWLPYDMPEEEFVAAVKALAKENQ